MGFLNRKSKKPEPEVDPDAPHDGFEGGHESEPSYVDSDDEEGEENFGVPPPPPPPSAFEENAMTGSNYGDETGSYQVYEDANRGMEPLMQPSNNMDASHIDHEQGIPPESMAGMEMEEDTGSIARASPFRRTLAEQREYEEDAGMDEIEIPDSTVVSRINQRELEVLEPEEKKNYKKYGAFMFLGAAAVTAVVVGSVMGTRPTQRSGNIAGAQSDSAANDASTNSPTLTPVVGGPIGGPIGGTFQPTTVPVTSSPTIEPTAIPTELPTPMPTSSPTEFPTMAPTISSSAKFLMEAVNASAESINNPDSPHGKALAWILGDDNSGNDFSEDGLKDGANASLLKQRFAAAVIYHSLDMDQDPDSKWMTDANVCDWEGITCGTGSRRLEDADFKDVIEIDLHDGGLQGPFPSEFSLFPNLKSLKLFENSLTGPIPSEIYSLTELEELDLFSNKLTGTLSSDIEDLTQLEMLYLSANGLTGQIPTSLQALKSLQELWIGYNNFDGTLPTEIGELSSLQRFRSENAMLSGAIPSELGQLNQLEELMLEGNSFTGGIPAGLESLAALRILNLSDIPSLNLSTFPNALLPLSNLRILKLNGLEIGGGIPEAVWNLPNLIKLELDNNQFTGEIPSPPADSEYLLRKLSISNNQLTAFGKPFRFAAFKRLSDLDISNNKIEKTLPRMIANLGKADDGQMLLKSLNLSNNLFTGVIPPEIVELNALEKLDLSGNTFSETATVPDGLCDFDAGQWISLVADCTLECSCCTMNCRDGDDVPATDDGDYGDDVPATDDAATDDGDDNDDAYDGNGWSDDAGDDGDDVPATDDAATDDGNDRDDNDDGDDWSDDADDGDDWSDDADDNYDWSDDDDDDYDWSDADDDDDF